MTPKMTRRMQAVRTVLNSEYYESRREAMKTLYTGGATLEEIGAVYGVTRERVRQVIAGNAKRGKGIDPIRAVTVCRHAGGFAAARRELGTTSEALRETLLQLGYWNALRRLWRWRARNAKSWYSDGELIAALRNLAERLGHTPGMVEVNADPDMPCHTTYVKRWGNWGPACIAAGLTPSARGEPGHKQRRQLAPECLHGHPWTPENTYIWRGKRQCRECGRIRHRTQSHSLEAVA